MSDRKHTPDILAEILTGDAPASEIDFVPPAARPPRTAPKKPNRKAEKPAREDQPAQEKPAARKPAAPPRPSQSQAWEYQVASFQQHNGWRVRFIDGREVKNWAEGLTLSEYNAYAGEQAWELAGACSGTPMFGRSDTYQLFYKRIKAG